ncbi:hypothetical protein [Antarcticimicrobium sediminis]|uniref:Uncharacterized protein n=1 Tax=Antarcticimicrobium sediminis TaxID=2546227 RepID=A0A4R5EF56_9RHOB|nr:hypothetical protein [Antarcticimicrobium sediminis]TDE32991.1 hypothetical protein E1B25_21755 [Antarcticimicrobium sediminis]
MQSDEGTADKLPDDVSIPSDLQFSARGFANEEYAKEAIYKLHSVLSVISQSIDLTNLDGVTVAFDYDEALAELDRGYETTYKLSATKGVAIGVAMAPTVIRDGVIKTHLVLNANYALSILEEPGEETEDFGQSLHLVAHECAHVEVTAAFDRSFPKILLQKKHNNILDNMRWQVILATWDEYAVCRIVGSIGYDPADGYLETLVNVLGATRGQVYEMIKVYRAHGDVGQVAAEVYGRIRELLKYSSYFLGAVAAQENPETHPAVLTEEANFGWFSPFYERLVKVHEALWSDFGKWDGLNVFEALGDILEDMAESIGVEASRVSDDSINFNIPYRRETMPDGAMMNPPLPGMLDR